MTGRASTYLQERLASEGVDANAIIETLRMTTTALDQVMRQHSEHAATLAEITSTLHQIDKRLAVFENNSVGRLVQDHEDRIKVLEAAEQRREGAAGLTGWIAKMWPVVVGVGALFWSLLRDRSI